VAELPLSKRNGDVERVLDVVVAATRGNVEGGKIASTCVVPVAHADVFDEEKFRTEFAKRAPGWRLDYVRTDPVGNAVDVRVVHEIGRIVTEVQRKVARRSRTTLHFMFDCYRCDTADLKRRIEDTVPNATVHYITTSDAAVSFDVVLNEPPAAS
jgi:hypothetical protein